jgi:hypothetical protein
MESREVTRIWRAAEATDPALIALTAISHRAAREASRHLALVTGLPGAGKTLVGLQLVYARFLDSLAVDRPEGRPTAPAVYLSGNGPLVRVLQYELSRGDASGKTFVRDVHSYVRRYSASRDAPPEHVLVFDEAQRAFSRDKVRLQHPDLADPMSEPEHFLDFAYRIPRWSVLVGFVGLGQEIGEGEEGGLVQWRDAIHKHGWRDMTIHGPSSLAPMFDGLRFEADDALHLAEGLRYRLATGLHSYVDNLLAGATTTLLRRMAEDLEREGFVLRVSRDLDTAKRYLNQRYAEDRAARYGVLASSRDSSLPAFGIHNDFRTVQRVKIGPWFGDDEESPLSCRRLEQCVTEYWCQGLELDAALVAWGMDLIRDAGRWSNKRAKRYQRPWMIRDPMLLRVNAYRVLLTRARDGVVVFVPPMPAFDETSRYLLDSGFVSLDT